MGQGTNKEDAVMSSATGRLRADDEVYEIVQAMREDPLPIDTSKPVPFTATERSAVVRLASVRPDVSPVADEVDDLWDNVPV